MNYIILDLEWNQSPRGKNSENKKIPFEIVEIGAVKLNASGEIIGQFNKIIKPSVYRELHHIIRDLTGFTMEELNRGIPFNKAVSEFISWCGEDFRFCTWGSLDILEFQRNMDYYHIPLPKPPIFYYDLQKIFNIVYENGSKATHTLEYAVDYLKIPISSSFHRALDDAIYTAMVFKQLDRAVIEKYYSIDYYQNPKTKQDEIQVVFDTYSKYVSREFDSKNSAMEDKTVTSTICYKCGRRTRKKIRWFSDNSKIYYCLCNCPEHGLLKGKIRMKKTAGEKYFVVKTMKLTNEAGAAAIKNRQLEIRNKRRAKRLIT